MPKGNWVELRDKDVLRLAELPQYVPWRRPRERSVLGSRVFFLSFFRIFPPFVFFLFSGDGRSVFPHQEAGNWRFKKIGLQKYFGPAVGS